MRRALLVATLVALAGCGARRDASTPPGGARRLASENQRARELLCGDIGEASCLAVCAEAMPPREHAQCLIELRFRSDPAALELAKSLYARVGAVPGVDMRGVIEGFRGQSVELFPALPMGEHRHHLAWLDASLESFGTFVDAIATRASRPVGFEPRPKAFAFFRTSESSYPSAYCAGGIISYNLVGPLHTDQREMHETLFHELFHHNDALHDAWTKRVLAPVFDAIIERCKNDHECLLPFAPHRTVVPDGTFYAFDERTRDVREYGAELAVRYFLEHEALLGPPSDLPPPPASQAEAAGPSFKCLTPENRFAWTELANEFFGGVDLTPGCDEPAAMALLPR